MSCHDTHGPVIPSRPAKDERAAPFWLLNCKPKCGGSSHRDASHDGIPKFEVIEQGSDVGCQSRDGEVFQGSKVALSMAAKIGVEDVQRPGCKTRALRHQEA